MNYLRIEILALLQSSAVSGRDFNDDIPVFSGSDSSMGMEIKM
jgi:hypothetical protein